MLVRPSTCQHLLCSRYGGNRHEGRESSQTASSRCSKPEPYLRTSLGETARNGRDAFPRNAITKRHYRVIKVFILASQSYGSPLWLTYKEAGGLGGHVRQGEHGTPIVFWKSLSREVERNDGTVAERHFPMLRCYTVFNADQTEGCRLPADVSTDGDGATFNPIDACEAVYANMPKRPILEHGATMAITRGHRFEAFYPGFPFSQ
jgi:antirestriction protein ArdC